MRKKKFGLVRILILIGIVLICGVLYSKNFKEDKGLRVVEWDNIYNDNNITFFYEDIENKPSSLKKLDSTYGIDKLIDKNKGELERALQTVDIVNSIVELDEVQDSLSKEAYGILEEKGGNKKVSDRDMAIIERDILLSAGFISRVGEFRKEKPQFQKDSSYYVVEYWSNEYKKWVMIDFKDRGYLEDRGTPLSAIELMGMKLKDLTYVGKSSQNDYRKRLSPYISSYTIAIDNTLSMKKSNSYVTYLTSNKDIDMKKENEFLPATIFTSEKDLFLSEPGKVANAKDSRTYIIMMRKPMEASNSFTYVVGAFENGSTIKDYYLRINDGEMKKIDRYEDLELVKGSNKIELSKDGSNIISKVIIERDE